MTVDLEGRWTTTQGYALVQHEFGGLSAELRFVVDDDVYHHVQANVDSEDGVDAVITSPGRDMPPFELYGRLFRGDFSNGLEPMMMLLTDGTTVLGLAFGAQSQHNNL
ncbi:MAG: hypothetical protein ACRENP_07410 [Longimicrobiales bacterium]